MYLKIDQPVTQIYVCQNSELYVKKGEFTVYKSYLNKAGFEKKIKETPKNTQKTALAYYKRCNIWYYWY